MQNIKIKFIIPLIIIISFTILQAKGEINNNSNNNGNNDINYISKIYVTQNGSSNCSILESSCSLFHALQIVSNNSIIYISNGFYKINSSFIISASNITLLGQSEGGVIIAEDEETERDRTKGAFTFLSPGRLSIQFIQFQNFISSFVFNILSTGSVYISSCSFLQNYGTAINMTGFQLHISNSVFSFGMGVNFVEFTGSSSNSVLNITNSKFNDRLGHSNTPCGAVRIITGTAYVVNSQFVNCHCVNSAFYGQTTVPICNRVVNEAQCFFAFSGGAIYTHSVTFHISNSYFEGNTAGYGGAVATFDPPSISEIQTSVFKNNSAVLDGGALSVVGDPNGVMIKVDHCTFAHNTASRRGSAAYFDGRFFNFFHSIFLYNYFLPFTNSTREGGAFYHYYYAIIRPLPGEQRMNNVTFEGNSDTAVMACAEFNFCRFSSNHALDNLSGGITCRGNTSFIVRSSSFINNLGLQGGALHIDNFALTITNSYFLNNFASTNGGALSFPYTQTSLSKSTCTISNSKFEDNKCDGSGSALYSFADEFTMTESTILNDGIGATIYFSYDKEINYISSLFLPPIPNCSESTNHTSCQVTYIPEPTTNEDKNNNSSILLAIVLPITIVGSAVIIFIIITMRIRSKRNETNKSTSEITTDDIVLEKKPLSINIHADPPTPKGSPTFTGPISELESCLIYEVHIGREIGAGAFGTVYEGTWHGAKVAVKSLVDQNFSQLSQEALTMKKLSHPNIVQFMGIYKDPTELDILYMVTEFVDGGNLELMLRNSPDFFTTDDLIRISMEVASGMRLMEQKGVLHRDLAARNVLIDTTKQDLTAKVADFGMSRQSQKDYYTASNNIIFPIKWSAPEVIKFNKYSAKADVWAMGVTMWEIFTQAEIPYKGMSNKEAADWVCEGNRLKIPSIVPSPIKELIKSCWNENPQSRPSFKEIYDTLQTITNNNNNNEINHNNSNNTSSEEIKSSSTLDSVYSSPNLLHDTDDSSGVMMSSDYSDGVPAPPTMESIASLNNTNTSASIGYEQLENQNNNNNNNNNNHNSTNYVPFDSSSSSNIYDPSAFL